MNVMAAPSAGLLADPYAARLAIRSGAITGSTAGLAPGFVQGNIVILPMAQASAFAAFCRANPKACPLIATGEPGDPSLPGLGRDIDMRRDLSGYLVYRDGVAEPECSDVTDIWRDDLVTCVIGCSFTFEAALIASGIPLRHVEQRRNVAMYRTNIRTTPSGPFRGPLVVSMRPMTPENAARAIEITAQFPDMHGAPIHVGPAAALGIADLDRPDFGDAVEVAPGEIPVFWACGVTSQVAVEQAALPFFIAHAPGKMLITDWRHAASA